jgi:hypothetical protein
VAGAAVYAARQRPYGSAADVTVDTGLMVLSRRWAWFLVGVGVWTWIIWPRFALAIWNDPRAWSTGSVGHGSPTSFLWVHALLIVVSLVIGTLAGILGVRALLAIRRRGEDPASDVARRHAGGGR